MGFKAMTWASSLKTGSPTKKLILLMLADRANDEGFCWPSTSKIAEDCELRRETVSRNIKEMERDGILHVQKHENGGKYKNNIYYLHVTQDHSPCEGESHDHVSEDHTNLSIEPEKEPCAQEQAPTDVFSDKKPKKHKKPKASAPPTIKQVIEYATKAGNGNQEYITKAKEAFDYYEGNMHTLGAKVWKDGNGNTVGNWKLKIRNNWFIKIGREMVVKDDKKVEYDL